MALEQADGDGLVVDVLIDASTFAQDLHGADARATEAEDVGIENCFGRTHQISGGDFLDEARDVYMRGASGGTGCIEAEQAAVGFCNGCLWS